MELSAILASAIGTAGHSFADGELAFLALTSKVERPLLDRISYQLHVALQPLGLMVAREYPAAAGIRCDVAVLREGRIAAAIEAKAMYTADGTRQNGLCRQYPDLLETDLRRYSSVKIEGLKVYSLLLATHLLAAPPSNLRQVIKYSPMLNQAFKSHTTANTIRDIAEQGLGKLLRLDLRKAAGTLKAGHAFGIEVELLWWLYGPFSGSDGWAILRSETTGESTG
jgi:hypothetical protein